MYEFACMNLQVWICLELDLETIVNHHVGAWNWMQIFLRSTKDS